jgi:hypothetical protein
MSENANEPKLSLLDKAKYQLKSREALIAEHAAFAAEIVTLKASLESAEADKTALSARIADLEVEANTGKEMAVEVIRLKAEAKSAEQRAAAIAAESLVPVADLPKAADEIKQLDRPLTNAEKEEALKACKTQEEKMALFRSWKK